MMTRGPCRRARPRLRGVRHGPAWRRALRDQTRPWRAAIGSRSTSRWSIQGRAGSGDLLVEVEIAAVGEHQRRAPVVRPPKAADLYDPSDRRGVLEGLDAPEANVVGASRPCHRSRHSLAGQFVMESPVDQPADDRRSRLLTIDHIVSDATGLPAVVKTRCIVLMTSPRMPRVAEIALGLQPDHPLAGAGRRSEPHLLQVLEPSNHQTTDFGVGRSGISGRRSMRRFHPAAMRISTSSRVQRSAAISFSRALRISCSGFGPSSIDANSSARERRPRLM